MLVLLLLFAANLLIGSVSIPARDVIRILLGEEGVKESWRYIVWEARLPQAFTALLSGSALAVCGLLLQTVFRNPLAGTSILGVNSGAGLGVAVVTLLLGGSVTAATFSLSGFFSLLAGAFVGAMAVMALILFFSLLIRSNVMLLITGIMVGYLASSAISLLNYVSTAEGVRSYMLWGMGNFGGVSMQQMPGFAAVVLLGLAGALLLIKPLNALLLGETHAAGLGIAVRRSRVWIIVATCILAGACTAFTGPVSFIGVAVPHIARGIFRSSDHRVILPACILCGATLLLVCDIISQLPGTGYTLPINSVSALVGVPIILWVIFKNKSLAA